MAEWEDYVAEYRRDVIGPLLEAEISNVVQVVSSHYPPQVYAGSASWGKDSRSELVQDVMVALLENSKQQLNYVMNVSADLSDFRGLVGKHTKRTLSHRRRRTVVDNLLDRIRNLLAAEPYFRVQKVGDRWAYSLRENAEYRNAAPDSLRRAALRVAAIPRVPPPATGDRAPMVYDAESLRLVVRSVAQELPDAFTEQEIGRVLEEALTGWVPILLESDVAIDTPDDPQWSELDLADAREAAARALAGIDAEQGLAIALRSSGRTHEQIAEALGYHARQTAVDRINGGHDYLRGIFSDLSDEAQVVAAEIVLSKLLEEGRA